MNTEVSDEGDFLFDRAIAMLYHAFDPEREKVSFMTLPAEDEGGFARWLYTADKDGSEAVEGEPLSAGYISVSRSGPEIIIVTTWPMFTVTLGQVVLDT